MDIGHRIPNFVQNNVGLVPTLYTAISKNGYEVSASSKSSLAFHVFTPANGKEWETLRETRDFWIQIKLPQPVIIYQISLRGKNSSRELITDFILKASNDGDIWINLLTIQRMIGTTIEFLQFPNAPRIPHMYYRIHALQAEGISPGLSHWQLYSLDPLII